MTPRLDKRLGQHHLRQAHLCRPMIEFLEPAGERVVEIGPGGGVLSGLLLDAGARVWAIELDPAWAFAAKRRLPASDLELVVADALETPFDRLPTPTLVAGNLPYNVATEIIARLLPWGERVPRAAFLVQKEVADRLAASPGTRAFGALTVLVSTYATISRLGTIKPGAFRPPPKVDSAMIGLALHPPPLPEPEMAAFRDLVKSGFAFKRKTLRNALSRRWSREIAEGLLDAAGIDGRRRAEAVALEEWVELHRRRIAAGV